MKKQCFALLAFLFLCMACTDKGGKVDPENPDNSGSIGGGTGGGGGKIPSSVVGKWSYGVFSPSNFWGYDGVYKGNAYEQALVFVFNANGTYEQYVINSVMAYNCRTEAYTYFKGSVKVNEANHTLTITPTEGRQRGYYSCAPKSNIDRPAKASEMKQETFTYQVDGKAGIKLSDAEAPNGVYLKAIAW
ncbi:hypothetical protein [Tellurirhabdus bombi]|uniref:hypothetical protein n=1 Tax=Tellurirhabdus bombi TaxID=2907205 RepID=UPI001F27816D|nr:hypothetical protein [Tellurirhabdus bombi]